MMWKQCSIRVNGRIQAGAVRMTERALAVAALFGIPLDGEAERVLFQEVDVPLGPGEVVLITGSSGAGKSTLLRRLGSALPAPATPAMVLDHIPLPADRPVVDCFVGPLEIALGHLARAGLSEAPLLLRSPAELSEGQQFRYRLAQFFASGARVLIADEFGATLDRVTARVVAWQLGKFIRASKTTNAPRAAILATTHEDLAEDLQPTVHLWKGLGEELHLRIAGG